MNKAGQSIRRLMLNVLKDFVSVTNISGLESKTVVNTCLEPGLSGIAAVATVINYAEYDKTALVKQRSSK